MFLFQFEGSFDKIVSRLGLDVNLFYQVYGVSIFVSSSTVRFLFVSSRLSNTKSMVREMGVMDGGKLN